MYIYIIQYIYIYIYISFFFCLFDSASLPFLNRLPGGCSGGEGTPPEACIYIYREREIDKEREMYICTYKLHIHVYM